MTTTGRVCAAREQIQEVEEIEGHVMSRITRENIVMKLRASAANAEQRRFSGELYRAAADLLEELLRGQAPSDFFVEPVPSPLGEDQDG